MIMVKLTLYLAVIALTAGYLVNGATAVSVKTDLSGTKTATASKLPVSEGLSSKAAPVIISKIDQADENDEDDDDDVAFGPQQRSVAQPSSTVPVLVAASSDLKTAAGGHYPSHHDAGHGYGGHHYGKYYQYASVPYPHAWEFGYRRGNPYHTIERHEKGKGPHFHTKVKWSDKHGGYGVHVWDYNHDDHHSGHHYGGHHGDSYGHGHSHYGAGHHGGSHYAGHH